MTPHEKELETALAEVADAACGLYNKIRRVRPSLVDTPEMDEVVRVTKIVRKLLVLDKRKAKWQTS